MAETLGFPVPLPQRFRSLSITCPGFLTTCRLVARLDVASLHGRGPARHGRVLGPPGPLTLGREPVPLGAAVGTALALPHLLRALADFRLEFVVHRGSISGPFQHRMMSQGGKSCPLQRLRARNA